MEKAEVEEKSIENSKKMIKGETLPHPYQPSNEQMQESLKVMNEETLQLSEFLLQEEILCRELCVLLKQVLKHLNMSFNLPANVFPQTEKTQRIILNDEAHLIFVNNKNEVKSKALEDYPPQVILNVASFIIPELSRSLTSYRKEIGSRIDLFERINNELRNFRNIFVNRPRKLLEEDINPADNRLKRAPLAKQKGFSEENKRDKESA